MSKSKPHVLMIFVVDRVAVGKYAMSFDRSYRPKKPKRYAVTGRSDKVKSALVAFRKQHGDKTGRFTLKQVKKFIKDNSHSFTFEQES